MKKLFMFLAMVMLSAVVYAESSTIGGKGTNYREQVVNVIMYNNSGAEVSENSVVILDNSGTAGTTLGSYFTTATAADSVYVCGVTDQTIGIGQSGRVTVRGPHKVYMAKPAAAGVTVGTCADAGVATPNTSTSNLSGKLGYTLQANLSDDVETYIWVAPNVD